LLSPSRFSHWIRQKQIWLIFAASLVGYGLAWVWFPLRPYLNQLPLSDIRTFTPSLLHGVAYAVWLSLLYGLYGLAYRLMRREERPFPLPLIIITTLILALPLIQTYPINANDIYRYVIRGRISSVYGQNPFVTPPNALSGDPFLPFAGEWVGATSPYGPVWEMVATAVTSLSRNNLYQGLILFKLLGLTAHLAVTGLIWRLLVGRPVVEQTSRTLLWAWNPALLLMFVVDGHNDVLMLFWLLLGWWLMQRRPAAGLVVMLLGVLTKPIGLLPMPFFFIWGWRQMPDNQARWRFLLGSVLGSGTAVFLTFLPFGSPLDLFIRLQSEASAGASFSFSALLLLLASWTGVSLTAVHINGLALVMVGLLVGGLAWLDWLVGHGRSPLKAAADSFTAYLLTALNFRLWYTTWLFPWLLLDEEQEHRKAQSSHGDSQREGEDLHSSFIIHHSSFRLRAGLWLLLTTQLSVLIYGHLRVYVLGGNYLLAHLIGLAFTFGVPLLLARYQTKHPINL
jgi:hypothetical protein